MADENILRSYRSSDATRRSSAAGASREQGSSSDPLVELARLIGQTDPFADMGRPNPAPPRAAQRDQAPAADWRQTAAALARESLRGSAAFDEREERGAPDTPVIQSYRTEPNHDFSERAFAEPHAQAAFRDHEQRLDDQSFDHQRFDDQGFDEQSFDDAPRFGGEQPDDAHAQHQHADQQQQHVDQMHQAFAPPQPAEAEENYFFDDAAPPDDAAYDDPPRVRSGSNSLLTAVVLVGCAILGTAGAYGYRSYYSSAARSANAPIISADTTPSKVIPASANDSGKSKDRIGDSGGSERMVAHQEDPVTLADSAPPRVVLPAPFTPSPAAAPSVQSGPPATSDAAGQPRKVRTVPIRPDGSEAPRPAGQASAGPIQLSPSAVAAATPRAPAPATRPAAQPTSDSPAPLSLQPGGSPAAAQAPARERVAVANPNPPELASVPAAAGGGYVVQVSSQRSQADAQSSFHSLQSKFPRELGDRQPIVRRADLGPKGVYYRAMVGPFGTAVDADQFCGSLKAAGGQCIVQKN